MSIQIIEPFGIDFDGLHEYIGKVQLGSRENVSQTEQIRGNCYARSRVTCHSGAKEAAAIATAAEILAFPRRGLASDAHVLQHQSFHEQLGYRTVVH